MHRIEIDASGPDPSELYLPGKSSDLYLMKKSEVESISSLDSDTPNMDFQLSNSTVKRKPSKIRVAATVSKCLPAWQ